MRARATSSVLPAVGLIASALACLGACSAPAAREELPVDCSVTDSYDLWTLRPFDTADSTWYAAADGTGQVKCDDPDAIPGTQVDYIVVETGDAVSWCDGPRRATAAATVEPLPDGPRCGGDYGLRLTGQRNNDWGSLYGDYVMAGETRDASDYDGVAFWARAEPGTGKALLLLLNDKYTQNILDEAGNPVMGQESACNESEYSNDPAQGMTQSQVGGSVVPGAVPEPGDCGNAYQLAFRVTEDWKFYRLPFASFHQEALPNRHIEGVDSASLRSMIFRAPKDTVLDIWLDDIGYYRELD